MTPRLPKRRHRRRFFRPNSGDGTVASLAYATGAGASSLYGQQWRKRSFRFSQVEGSDVGANGGKTQKTSLPLPPDARRGRQGSERNKGDTPEVASRQFSAVRTIPPACSSGTSKLLHQREGEVSRLCRISDLALQPTGGGNRRSPTLPCARSSRTIRHCPANRRLGRRNIQPQEPELATPTEFFPNGSITTRKGFLAQILKGFNSKSLSGAARGMVRSDLE